MTSTDTAAVRMRSALEALCALAEEHRRFLVTMDSDADPVFHLDAPTGNTRDVYLAPLERILTDAQRDGSLHVDDPVDTAVLLFNLVPRTYVHLRVGHGWTQPRATSQLLAFALASLAPKEPSPT